MFPANGAAPRGWSRKAVHRWGRVDGLRRGRCKYVHVSSVAASMRLTPLRSPSTRPRTGSVRVHPRRRKRRSKAKTAWRIASLPCVEPKAAAGAAANVAHGEGPKGAGQDDRHSHARLTSKRSARPASEVYFLFRGGTNTESVSGRVGGQCGVSAAWMPRPSPHGWVHGVPALPTHPASPQQSRFQRPTPPTRGCAVGWKLPDSAQRPLWKRSHDDARQHARRPKSVKSVSWFTLLQRVDPDQWTCRNRPAQWRPVRHGAPSIVAARGGVGREAVLVQRVQGARGTATGERQPRRYRPDPVAGCVCGDGDATGNLYLNGETGSRGLHISRCSQANRCDSWC